MNSEHKAARKHRISALEELLFERCFLAFVSHVTLRRKKEKKKEPLGIK